MLEFFAQTNTVEDLSIVVAVKSGKRSKVWFVSSRTPAPAERRDSLRTQLEALPPPIVRGGPIAFAIEGRVAGGISKGIREAAVPPTPPEWQEAISKLTGPTLFDGLLASIWPDAPGDEARVAATVPEGFVMQILEPTGGSIPRPKDWFYKESHSGASYVWTISREDISKGDPYTTGVRIQTFIGVKENTGKTPKEFILEFIASKKKEAARVIETCEERDQGMFTRACLQTEEGPYRILYSLFWGNNNLDMAVVSISGTTKDLWETYSPTFDKMGPFELINMKRFEK